VGFCSLFELPDGRRCLSDTNRHFLGRRSVSLTTYRLLGPPAVCPSVLHFPLSMVALTTVRDRDHKVYSVTASCWQGEMKGPAVSGLTTRGICSLMDSRQEETNLTSLKCKAQTQARE
jgi:hypothetical protein